MAMGMSLRTCTFSCERSCRVCGQRRTGHLHRVVDTLDARYYCCLFPEFVVMSATHPPLPHTSMYIDRMFAIGVYCRGPHVMPSTSPRHLSTRTALAVDGTCQGASCAPAILRCRCLRPLV
jgi:hypothetical protein